MGVVKRKCVCVCEIYGCGLWVSLKGGIYFPSYYLSLLLLYNYIICSFLQQHPYFVFILKMFCVLVPVFILCVI